MYTYMHTSSSIKTQYNFIYIYQLQNLVLWWIPHVVVDKVLDNNNRVSEFELQLSYYIHFQTNMRCIR